jgi:hypothetical protein
MPTKRRMIRGAGAPTGTTDAGEMTFACDAGFGGGGLPQPHTDMDGSMLKAATRTQTTEPMVSPLAVPGLGPASR